MNTLAIPSGGDNPPRPRSVTFARVIPVNRQHAAVLGEKPATFVAQLQYWLLRASRTGPTGLPVVWKTYADWQAEFVSWSRSTIIRVVKRLKKLGVLLVARLRAAQWNQTNYYGIDQARLDAILTLSGASPCPTPSRQPDALSTTEDSPEDYAHDDYSPPEKTASASTKEESPIVFVAQAKTPPPAAPPAPAAAPPRPPVVPAAGDRPADYDRRLTLLTPLLMCRTNTVKIAGDPKIPTERIDDVCELLRWKKMMPGTIPHNLPGLAYVSLTKPEQYPTTEMCNRKAREKAKRERDAEIKKCAPVSAAEQAHNDRVDVLLTALSPSIRAEATLILKREYAGYPSFLDHVDDDVPSVVISELIIKTARKLSEARVT